MTAYQIESDLGKLTVFHGPYDAPTIEFEFETHGTSKLYILKLSPCGLVAFHRLFAFDPTIALDITKNRPDSIELKNDGVIRLLYEKEVAGRMQQIVFCLPEQGQLTGVDRKIIELERVNEAQKHANAKLLTDIQELRDEVNLLRHEAAERKVVHVPFNRLMMADEMAHQFMLAGYLRDEYKAFVGVRPNTSISQLIATFIDTDEKRLLFNLNVVNRSMGYRLEAAAKLYWVPYFGTPSGLNVKTGTSVAKGSLAFECTKTRQKYKYGLINARMLGGDSFDKAIKFIVPKGCSLWFDAAADGAAISAICVVQS